MKRMLLLMAVISGFAVFTAQSEPLSGDGINTLISGKRVFLKTPYGLEFPLRYNSDGTVSGDASGFTMAKMLAPKETGKWWIKGPKLCQQWKTWYNGKALCFTIDHTGSSTLDWKRDDGLAGTARIE
ncbi:MAG TPA: hypothetical protein VIU14_13125 [Mesorhizobium sp.]